MCVYLRLRSLCVAALSLIIFLFLAIAPVIIIMSFWQFVN